jgi:Flp pilus assembly protein TadD
VAALIVCPACGTKVRAGRDRCPKCRGKLSAAAKPPRFDTNRVAPIVLALLAVAAVASGIGFWRQASDSTEPIAAPRRATPRAVPASPAEPRSDGSLAAAPEAVDQDVPFLEPNREGGLAYEAGEYDRALALYQEAVEHNPDDAESWSNLGQVLVRLGQTAEAIPHFERAIELQGQRWAYHFNLARARGLLGQWAEAVEGYRAAQQLFPDDYATAYNLGLALRQTGDEAGAIEQFERAIALDPAEPTFRLSLAMSYEKLGRNPEAAAAYQKTLDLAPEAPEAPQIRARIERLLH